MDETRFWSMIEDAWSQTGGYGEDRRALAYGPPPRNFEVNRANVMIQALTKALRELRREDLLAFDRILEKKLHAIDRADIHEYTDGSDDGFLYVRGFIVAMGRDYYGAIDTQPELASSSWKCEEMCYLSMHVYDKLFERMPSSDITRESFSNPDGGWDDSD